MLMLGGAACLGLIAVVSVTAALAWRSLNSPLDIEGESMVIAVEPGSSLRRIASRLHDENRVRYPRLLSWYAQLTGDATRVKAGEYEIPAGTTSVGLVALLVAGDVVQYRVTIIEGIRYDEALAVVRAHEAVTATAFAAGDIMRELGAPDLHPEGQFLPDTYAFARGTRDIDIMRRAHEALEDALSLAWNTRTEATAVTSPYEALILASIIEKETALPSERPLISGVFNRRLRAGMRLQADPTVIYGLGERYDGDIRTLDLRTDTPYNTYTRAGLPPTPIALPGAAAIAAALSPTTGDALYFVATGEPDGSHYFSATLEEHNAAVRRFLDRQRAGRSSP
jgi:UPF0755 protein